MTGFDTIVFLIVGLAAIAGFFSGFVEEVLSLAAWCVALLAVHYGHAALTFVVLSYIHDVTWAGVVAFAILLAVPYFATRALARSLGHASRTSVLGPVDRVLGFGFGAIKGFVIMVLAFSILVFGFDVVWGAKGRPEFMTAARTYPFLNAASDELMTLIAQRRGEALKSARDSTDPATAEGAPGDEPSHGLRKHRHRPERSENP